VRAALQEGTTSEFPLTGTTERMTGPPATGPRRAAAGWPSRVLPAASREIVTDCLAVIDGMAPLTERIDGELHQHAKADPRVKVLRTLRALQPDPGCAARRPGHLRGRIQRNSQPSPVARVESPGQVRAPS